VCQKALVLSQQEVEVTLSDGAVWPGLVTTYNHPVLCSVQYSTLSVQYSNDFCETVTYSTVQYSTVQYSTLRDGFTKIITIQLL
jgi:hypothetical protein